MTYINFKELEKWSSKPLEDKIRIAKETIEEALKQSKKPAVAFSGGKNSLVVLHLLLEYDPDVIVVYVNTTVEYPQNIRYVRKLAKEWNLNYYELKPDTTFWKVVEKYGFPDHRRWYKKEPKCCYYLKTKPAAIFYTQNGVDCVFTGISAFESRTRKIFIAHNGLMYRAKRLGSYKLKQPILKANPVGYWTDKDIWEYIEINGFNCPVRLLHRV